MQTMELTDFIVNSCTQIMKLAGACILCGFAASTILFLFGYGIYKALSLVNINNH